MATTWVLRTDTKGTGAQMVPLESVTQRRSSTEPVFVPREAQAAPEAEEPKPRVPHRFRIIDVMTRRVLANGVGARDAVDALRGVRRLVDVNVYVWRDELGQWSMLTLDEQRALFDFARADSAASAQ